MSGILHAEIRTTETAIVKVNIAQHCRFYSKERAEFDGTDEEFVRQSLEIIGVHDILTYSNENIDDGITVELDDGGGEELTILARVGGDG